MKKTLFLLVSLAYIQLLNAQVVLHEDFGGSMPPEGWSISAHAANWSAQPSSNAGGQAPEARFSWTPQFTGQTYLISPSLDLSGNTSGILLITFRHMVDHYGGAYRVGLAVRSHGEDWSTVWERVNPVANIAAQQVSLELDTEIITSDDFQLAFFFSGSSFNINYWYVDDVQVVIPRGFDLAVAGVDIPAIFHGEQELMGAVVNMGMEEIQSFDVNWQMGEGAVHTTSFEGLDLAFGESFVFEAEQHIDVDPGAYILRVFLSNINGQEADDDEENNVLDKNVFVAYQTADRRPLFEMFTSSTCPPCATFNNGFFNQFTTTNADDIALIKYQMNWPGSGDPYYTPEGGVRRTYYGISGVPSLIFDGNPIALNTTLISNSLQDALQQPAYAELTGEFEIIGDEIFIEGFVMPYADFTGVRLHVVVIESVTYNNAATNGETSFHHVMHKMLPNAQGTSLSLSALQAHDFEFNFNMSSTNVEDMDDLKVVVFLQEHNSKEVYQSAYLAEVRYVSYNLQYNAEDVDVEVHIEAYYPEPVHWLDGAEINEDNVADLITFHEAADAGSHVGFTAFVNDEKNTITIIPEHSLAYHTAYHLNIETVMGESGIEVQGRPLNFTTVSNVQVQEIPGSHVSLFPNPAVHTLNVVTGMVPVNAHIKIFNTSGRLMEAFMADQQHIKIDVSGMPAGIYILVLSTEQYEVRRRFTVVH
ncbi:MAG: T9SS type A sorting domain-containing protein [Bacteroidales bacterium]|nr:T9SS type A sorting domain-containing protein [Bacteroidales bacterium]